MSKGIGECERARAVRSMGGKEGGEGPKVTRGLRVTEVVIGRRDGGRGEAERAAAVGREEELEEEGRKIERGADSWVESTEEESEEGGRAKGTMEGRSDGETARGVTIRVLGHKYKELKGTLLPTLRMALTAKVSQ